MLDNEPTGTGAPADTDQQESTPTRRARRPRATAPAGPPPAAPATEAVVVDEPLAPPAKAARTRRPRKAAEPVPDPAAGAVPDPAAGAVPDPAAEPTPPDAAEPTPPAKATRARKATRTTTRVSATTADVGLSATAQTEPSVTAPARKRASRARKVTSAANVADDPGVVVPDPAAYSDSEPDAAPAAAAAAQAVMQAPATPRKRTRARSATSVPDAPLEADPAAGPVAGELDVPAGDTPETAPKKATRSRARKAAPASFLPAGQAPPAVDTTTPAAAGTPSAPASAPALMFMPPNAEDAEPVRPPRRRRSTAAATAVAEPAPVEAAAATDEVVETEERPGESDADAEDSANGRRRRRGRRGRGRGRADEPDDGDEPTTEPAASTGATEPTEAAAGEPSPAAESDDDGQGEDGGGTRRRRRRRRRGDAEGEDSAASGPSDSATRDRERALDEVQGVRGSTRLEAKRQRRREGRDQGRRRAPILSEAEFLARRESVERVMAVRQRGERTQIAVLEDGILVEHYVTKASSMSFAGNVYLGRVQNVLPSMEAAFVDIGKGRNAVLYAGEVNWDAAGLAGKSRSIEQALRPGDRVLVQVSKDPIGQKGARLTSVVNLAGRYLVYVPNGSMTGISRKLPDTERHRLKEILRRIVPEGAGVIIRTAAEGASEEELTRDVERLVAQWETISAKADRSDTNAPSLLHGEPDLAIRVVRDVFNEDFTTLAVSGDEAWDTLNEYLAHVAPDLVPRLRKHTAGGDLFAELRVDEQLAKAMDRKVYLPSGGSLVIDRTEAMTVVDVNTGKFVGSGGNLEQTVTRNNLEAAEEIVRQLRLRDVGGIIVIDFIDMVLETNRDLVLRRLTECLGRDRTKHQVAEVTSLGLVQMTRKRVGQGLLEAFSETCEVCHGRGLIVHSEPVDTSPPDDDRGGGRERSRRGGGGRAEIKPADPTAPGPHLVAAAGRSRTVEPDAELAGASPTDLPTSVVVPATEGAAPFAPAADGPADGTPTIEADAAAVRPRRRRAARSSTTTVTAGEPAVVVVPPAVVAPAAALPARPEPGTASGQQDGSTPSEVPESVETPADPPPRRRRRAASRPAGPPVSTPA